ncbi:MAG: NAD-dependent epimerase/dehydratase family protein [Ectothiorhodospiraceae bacterium]|nr:NAD-dependent epimerase/dehydratase family protein [Ectothiorhodospiraceae bacterium]
MTAGPLGVLVTGATGFVGRGMLPAVPSAWRLRLGVRRRTTPRGEQAHVALDLECVETLDAATEGVDCVLHLAGLAHDKGSTHRLPVLHEAINHQGTRQLAEAAARNGVRRFVFASTAKVYGEFSPPERPFQADSPTAPQGSYAQSKWAAEQALREVSASTGMEVVIVRPPLVYGPGVAANMEQLVRWVRRGVPLPFAAVENRRSIVARDNLVSLLVRAVEHPAAAGKVLLPTDAEDVSTPDLIRAIANALGRPARLLPVPPELLLSGAGLLGRRAMMERLCGNLQLDGAHTRVLLDWRPPVTTEYAMRGMVQALP